MEKLIVNPEELPAQYWEFLLDPAPKTELLVPFTIPELAPVEIHRIITKARQKKDPMLKSFGLELIHKFELNKLKPLQQNVLSRIIQSVMN